ncbi:hypothetical protein H6P81_000470 [Aristolochia fimbriata]|uniref:F-box protein n=1 Tax=Aristolochia fimbriata TaxID=158543 RepID=A0AAV7F4C4_ARIFI|nr:hypothetical protein H6P81_000470 [Aristolochia fimbriata]
MENLPSELSLKIFCLLDQQNLANAQQVCRKWKELASDNKVWRTLFKERWGINQAAFFAPSPCKSWKDVYEVQDRCDRVGLGLKIIREGGDYFLVHQGEIQRFLGSRRGITGGNDAMRDRDEQPCAGILDQILFFSVDLEVATRDAKRFRV